MTRDERKKKIDDLFRQIGGVEASILLALDEQEYDFADTLKKLRRNYYKRLKAVILYGEEK